MNTNPNTNVAGIAGGLGVLTVWLLGRYGIHVSNTAAAAISTAYATVVLYIGRDGLRSALRSIWRGKSTPPSPPSPGI